MDSRQQQSDKARRVFRAAQNSFGVEAVRLTLRLVSSTTPQVLRKNPAGFVAQWHHEINGLRKKSRKAGQAYYRLERAIWLSRTVDDGLGIRPTLNGLWNDLYDAADLPKVSGVGDPVRLDPSPWSEDDDRVSHKAMSSAFHFKATERLKKAETEADKNFLTVESLDELDDLLMESIADSLGGEAQRVAASGGREAIAEGVLKDPGALRYMRVPEEGACYFCIMLASRGASYRNKWTAGDADVRQFHPNCKCEAVPIFSTDYEYPPEVKAAVAAWDNFGGGNKQQFRRYLATHQREID
ncbi:VG15 protein [Streptomyces vinaceus]|uniref:VG15 protein n=1 Tax=Streptomyces vinaceus TaxID=1960 RepID=UPI0036B3039C